MMDIFRTKAKYVEAKRFEAGDEDGFYLEPLDGGYMLTLTREEIVDAKINMKDYKETPFIETFNGRKRVSEQDYVVQEGNERDVVDAKEFLSSHSACLLHIWQFPDI